MGTYGVLLAVLIAPIVFSVALFFVGFESSAKIADAVLQRFGWFPIIVAGLALNAIWFLGIGCTVFNWCPLIK
jgi:hypothetical protein